MHKVCIVVPTYSSGRYFAASFRALLGAAREVATRFETLIVVVLNGSTPADEREVRRAVEASDVPSRLIVTPEAGKNGAINRGLGACVEHGCDIVHVVDDDQRYAPGTLLINVLALLGMRERLNVDGLVGSRHIAVLGRGATPIERLASLAFEEWQEAPRFCIGGSMCTFVEAFPELPPDEKGIADDAFVCNTFYARFRDLYRTTGILPIVFPQGSKVYFNVALDLAEYERQQVRIRYGVLAGYRAFPELEQELRAYFTWKFHCDRETHPPRSVLHDLVELGRWRAFRWLRDRANRKAEARLNAGVSGVPWSVAGSTKGRDAGSRVGLARPAPAAHAPAEAAPSAAAR